MNIYDIFMYPLERLHLISLRKELIPKSRGDVLEIGAGTGVNFRYYKSDLIDKITVVDKEINKTARKRALDNMKFIEGDAIKLPFEDNSFDTVVETLLLCSVDGEDKAIEEIYRVLKPGGGFIHIDHTVPEGKILKDIFNLAAPIWRFFSRSCRINKTYKHSIENAGFDNEIEMTKGKGVFYGAISIKRW